MLMKTSELIGAQLDWAVAKCEGIVGIKSRNNLPVIRIESGRVWVARHPNAWRFSDYSQYNPSTDWAQGGPIIEREGISVSCENRTWSAYFRDHLFDEDGSEHWRDGPTPLIAAMRCYVASKLDDKVDIPKEEY